MSQTFLDGRVDLRGGDCMAVVRAMAANSIDSVVTDPPYALVSIGKRCGKSNLEQPANKDLTNIAAGQYKRLAGGFMGQKWDTGETAFAIEFWAEILRVLKPGGHVVAFSGARTYHRLACAIEDAGFEIRDQLMFLYGCGFSKSHSMRAIGRPELGTALKPASEPIVLARKPISEPTVAANVLMHGTGAINIDACRVGTEGATRKIDPAKRPTVSSYGNGLNGGGCETIDGLGRWPANVVHDGSAEVLAAFPETETGAGNKANKKPKSRQSQVMAMVDTGEIWAGDSGSAARFFYSAKADSNDRIGSWHPTVKPVDLMQWLCKLVTPPKGVILDPFAGTGTTGEAAWREGFSCILIEREPEYQADIARRMKYVLGGPDERKHAIIKSKGQTQDAGPLFEALL